MKNLLLTGFELFPRYAQHVESTLLYPFGHRALLTFLMVQANVFVHIFIVVCVIMTSAFLAISLLKQSSLPEKQLSNFLFYLSQEALREYLSNVDIYKGDKRISKSELVDMNITGEPRNIRWVKP